MRTPRHPGSQEDVGDFFDYFDFFPRPDSQTTQDGYRKLCQEYQIIDLHLFGMMHNVRMPAGGCSSDHRQLSSK